MAKKYDLVKIKDLSNTGMSHFEHSCRGIIVSSYNEKYGDHHWKDNDEYTVFIEGHGEVSWYSDNCFEKVIKSDQKELLDKWTEKLRAQIKKESDSDWIFKHPKEITSASIVSLANDLGITEDDMWGPHGEGFVFMQNAQKVYFIAAPFLNKKDLKGWKEHCEKIKQTAII